MESYEAVVIVKAQLKPKHFVSIGPSFFFTDDKVQQRQQVMGYFSKHFYLVEGVVSTSVSLAA